MDTDETNRDGEEIEADAQGKDKGDILLKAVVIGAAGGFLLMGWSLTGAIIGAVGGYGIARLFIGKDD